MLASCSHFIYTQPIVNVVYFNQGGQFPHVQTIPALVLILAISSSPALAKKGKWKILFDGRSTDSWRGFRQDGFPDQVWTVVDGTLTTVAGTQSIDIITKEKYRDFELELEWKIAEAGNSGVIYLVSEDFDQTWKTGPEMQVLDDSKHRDGLDPKTSAGSLYALIAPEQGYETCGQTNL